MYICSQASACGCTSLGPPSPFRLLPDQPAPTSADLLAEERELLATWLGMRTMELHVPFCINLYDDLYDKYMRTVWEIYGDIWEIPSGKRENN